MDAVNDIDRPIACATTVLLCKLANVNRQTTEPVAILAHAPQGLQHWALERIAEKHAGSQCVDPNIGGRLIGHGLQNKHWRLDSVTFNW